MDDCDDDDDGLKTESYGGQRKSQEQDLTIESHRVRHAFREAENTNTARPNTNEPC
jgi:hypothetical protein